MRLFDHAHDHPVTIVQMHGLRDAAGKSDTPAREAQAVALTRLIDRFRPQPEQLIVCGDFNVLPDSRLFGHLRGLGLTELVTSRGHTDTRTSHYPKTGRYADYLLTTPSVRIHDFDVIATPEVSDHRPLLLTWS